MSIATNQFTLLSQQVQSLDPRSIAWVSWVRASEIPGANNAAITAITPNIANGSGSYTGTATLKTASNGINNLNALSFNGTSDVFSSSTGAASLTGDFYCAVVVSFASISGYRCPLCWGDATSAEERCILKITDGDRIAFANGAGDVVVGTTNNTMSTSTVYFIEVQCVGGFVQAWVNGALTASGSPVLSAYTNTDILIGNDRFGSFFAGLLAESFFLGSSLSAFTQIALRNYIGTRYGITMALPGESQQVLTGTTGAAFTKISANPVQGTLAAHSYFGVHRLSNSLDAEGTLAIANLKPNGFSGITFSKPGTEFEAGAITTTLFDDAGSALGAPQMQLEASDTTDASNFGTMRFTQTKWGTGQSTRLLLDTSGDLKFYNLVVNSDGSHSEIFRINNGGGCSMPKTITAGGTTGAQTINKPQGSVNFAASAASLVVTNSLVTTSSVIVASVATNDATMKDVQAVAGSGSFTLYPNAVPTAETRVNFIVFN